VRGGAAASGMPVAQRLRSADWSEAVQGASVRALAGAARGPASLRGRFGGSAALRPGAVSPFAAARSPGNARLAIAWRFPAGRVPRLGTHTRPGGQSGGSVSDGRAAGARFLAALGCPLHRWPTLLELASGAAQQARAGALLWMIDQPPHPQTFLALVTSANSRRFCAGKGDP